MPIMGTPKRGKDLGLGNPVLQDRLIGAVVDTEYTPSTALLTYVAGSNWRVNYYQQILLDSQNLTEQQVNVSAVNQQYRLIQELELRVESPLTSVQDPQTSEFSMEGEAVLSPSIIPNVGDMMVADIGDGQAGVFSVSNVTRKSIYKDSGYAITYTLQGYFLDERKVDLESKVVETVYYSHTPAGGILDTGEKQRQINLMEALPRVIGIWLDTFWHSNLSTALVPEIKQTYDPQLISFIDRVLGKDELGTRDITLLRCLGDDTVPMRTVLDVIANADLSMLSRGSVKMRSVSASQFSVKPFYNAVSLSSVSVVVWPQEALTYAEWAIGLSEPTAVLPPTPPIPVITYGDPSANVVYPVDIDDYYIFSERFYTGDRTTMSALELAITRWLDGEEISTLTLETLTNDLVNWDAKTQFYLIPILIVLLKVSLNVK